MGKVFKLTVTLPLSDWVTLTQHLSTLIAKGSISTCPGWARKIIGRVNEAAREQYPDRDRDHRKTHLTDSVTGKEP